MLFLVGIKPHSISIMSDSSLKKSIEDILRSLGETPESIQPETVEFLTEIAASFVSDLVVEAAELTPPEHQISSGHVRLLVRRNPEMVDIVETVEVFEALEDKKAR
jgi:hypothetical protein